MLNALRRIILSLLVAVLVMTALASVMLRLLTPMLSEYRTDVEQWASQLIRQPISIESIDARMDGFTPKLNLSGVALLDLNREFAIARFGGLSIHFGVFTSLMSGKLTFDHIELHGLELSLVRDAEGAIAVSGLGGIKRGANESKNGQAGMAFGGWLLQQGKVSLYKSHIRWLDMQRQQSFDFPDTSMTLTNSGEQHTIHSMLELPEELGGGIEVALDLSGNLDSKESWGGSFYLKGEGLNSRTIFKGVALQQWQLQRGLVDGEFWGEIVAGEVTQIQGQFEAREVALAYREQSVPLSQFDSQALLQRVDSGWQLQLARINFGGALRGKMPHYLQLRQEAAGWRVTLDKLNMGALPPLIAVVKPELLGESPKFDGNLRSIDLFYGQGVERFRAGLDSIVVAGVEGMPSLSGLTGRAELRDGVMSLALNSPTLALNIPGLFNQPLPELAVNGKISARWESEGWQLWSHQLQLHNGDITLKVATNLQAHAKGAPHVAITAAIDVPELAQLKHYIPNQILKNGTAGWLQQAFHSGSLKQGELLIYGRGRDILDPGQGGRMEIALNPKAVDLQFHKDWPQIRQIDADIRFSGRKMTIRSNRGEVLSSGNVDRVEVRIDDFKKARLEVDGVAHFKAEDGVQYISLSPLQEILGKVGELVTASGEQELQLHLGIPLGINGDKPVAIDGKLEFRKVGLDIGGAVNVNDVNGVLAFNQGGVKRSSLKATIYQREHKFAIYKRRQGSQESTWITTQNQLDAQQILAAIELPWAREISGQSNWKAEVEFNHTRKVAQLWLKSDLKGVVSRLPHPANKEGDERLSLNMVYQFIGDSRKQVDMSLGDRLSAQLKFPERGRELQDIHIHLGSDSLKASKQTGLLFTGRLSQLDLDSWLRLLPEAASKDKGGFELPVTVDMERLHIRERAEQSSKVDKMKRGLKPASMPPLQVNINALKYGALQLGGVLMVSSPSRNELNIKKLVVSDGNYKLSANGSWKSREGTTLDLKVAANDTGQMLKSLRFDTPMSKGKLSARGTLRWPGSPADFELEKVKGDFHMLINNGVIEDVQSDAGQLLGLFNVRKVLNRIFLDFSDLNEKGLAYKELTGNFRLSRGNLYTDDFKMQSLQANMLLTGRTGLIKQDYDHMLSIIPQISDAVPVAGTLVFGPQVAVALLAFRKLFGKEFDKASMQQYRITGSWEKPNVEKIEHKAKGIEDANG